MIIDIITGVKHVTLSCTVKAVITKISDDMVFLSM